MAAKVDLEMGRELGVSATVVLAAATEHLRDGEHVVWSDAPGGQRRKEYTEAGRSLLRTLLGGSRAEKDGGMSLPGDGFTLWLPERAKKATAVPTLANGKEPAGGAQRGAVQALTILRIYPNPIWIRVKTPDGKTADVRVRHSRLLVAGKAVRCAPLANGQWECADPLLTTNPIYR